MNSGLELHKHSSARKAAFVLMNHGFCDVCSNSDGERALRLFVSGLKPAFFMCESTSVMAQYGHPSLHMFCLYFLHS